MNPVGIGIVGCGNISRIYVENLTNHPRVKVIGVSDLDSSKSRAIAQDFQIPNVMGTQELLEDPNVEIVLNLTTPLEHFTVSRNALEAGKSVYSEKPIAICYQEGLELLSLAQAKDCQIGSAPDTFLGAAHQECSHLIKSGVIGDVVGFQSFMMCPGHESWHPNPDFYYQPGAGPLFDMGPYYLSALVAMCGAIKSVAAFSKKTYSNRTITCEPLRGTNIKVEVETHISALLEMTNGAIGQLTTSFDVQKHTLPHIEIFGTSGSIQVPDPNGFGGEILLFRKGDKDWSLHKYTRPYSQNSRGIGLIDMALAMREKRKFRATGNLALHTLEAMESILNSAVHRKTFEIGTPIEAVEPMPCQEL